MTDTATMSDTRDIVIDEVFPHRPEVVWRTLTNAELIGRRRMGRRHPLQSAGGDAA